MSNPIRIKKGLASGLPIGASGEPLWTTDTNQFYIGTGTSNILISSTVTPSALTKTDDTNVTLTLGGSPNTALLAGTSLTLGWTGTLADNRITSSGNWNTAYNDRLKWDGGATDLVAATGRASLGLVIGTDVQAQLNGTGFVKASGTSITYDNSTYLTTISGIAASGELSGTYPSPTLVTSAVTGKLLTGLNLTGGGSIAATDSILQAFGKVQNQISGLAGGVTYQGTWNASTNTPTLTSSVGTKGYYYIVDVAGSTNLNGITDWKVGDWAIFNGSTWDKVDNTDAVSSVNGFTGAVSLTTANIPEVTNLYYLDSRARAAISLTTTGTSGAATYDNTTGVFNIPQYQGVLTNPITGTGTSGQVAYFNGTTSLTSSATFAFTPTSQLLVNNSVTAASQLARGTNLNSTLIAAANNDVLVGLDINPTFTNGAFTGIKNIGLRVGTFNYDLANQRLGLGTNIPTDNVELITSVTTGIAIHSSGSGANSRTYLNLARVPSIGSTSETGWQFIKDASDNLVFKSLVSGAATDRIYLFTTGNLGINTTTDAGFRLDVNGTARVQGTTTISGDNNLIFQRATDGNSLLGIELRGSGGAERGAFKINMSTGELRIGATTGGGFFPTFYTNGVEGGRFTTGGTFQTTASVTAASAIARGVYFNNTLVAAANNDVLVGLDINPTFTNGAFTGVSNLGLRVNNGTTILNGNNTFKILETYSSNFLETGANGTYRYANVFDYGGYNPNGRTNVTADVFSVGANASSSANGNRFFRINSNGGNSTGAYGASGNNNILAQLNATTSANLYITAQGQGGLISATTNNPFTISTISGGIDLNLRSDINGATGGGGINYISSQNGSLNSHKWFHNTTQQMQLFTTGNLLLQSGGTFTDAGFRLDVNGTARVQGVLTTTADASINSVSIGLGGGNISTNIRVGASALVSNTTGIKNTALGNRALRVSSTNDENTSIGYESFDTLTTGSYNVAIGSLAGRYFTGTNSITSSSSSIFIGYFTKALADSQTNQIVIGTGTTGLGSNTTVLGNSSTTLTALYGAVITGGTSVNASAQLQVDSTVRGFLPPRGTNAQRNAIASPAIGLVFYCTDATEGLYIYTASGWRSLAMV